MWKGRSAQGAYGRHATRLKWGFWHYWWTAAVWIVVTAGCGTLKHKSHPVKYRLCRSAADFGASLTYGKTPLTVTFTDKSTGAITQWQWGFGNNGTPKQAILSLTISLSGTAMWRIVDGDNNGTATVDRSAFSRLTTLPQGAPHAAQLQCKDVKSYLPNSFLSASVSAGTTSNKSPTMP